MNRSKSIIHKPIMLVLDQPIQSEIETDTIFSAPSSLELLGDLNKVGIPQNIITTIDGKKVIEKIIHPTYLTYNRMEGGIKSNFIQGKKNLPEDENYVELPTTVGVFVKESFWLELCELIEEIRRIRPKIIITNGKWTFYLLYGYYSLKGTIGTASSPAPLGGLNTFRGSICNIHPKWDLFDCILYPVIPVTFKYRNEGLKKIKTERAQTIMSWDINKLGSIFSELREGSKSLKNFLYPDREVIFGDSLDKVELFFEELLFELNNNPIKIRCAVDIETRYFSKGKLPKTANPERIAFEEAKEGIIDCIGFAYQANKAFWLPFSLFNNPTPWSLEDELLIYSYLRKVLLHQNLFIIGQNYTFDAQYIKKWFLIDRSAMQDTMISAHTLYNTLPKNLAFIASVYCENYSYWKTMENQEMENK